jgi:hypothetical protein
MPDRKIPNRVHIQIEHVDHRHFKRVGILEYIGDLLYLIPLDKKFDKMIVF